MIYKTALFTGESVKIIGYINKKASLVKCIDSRNRFFKTALFHLKIASIGKYWIYPDGYADKLELSDEHGDWAINNIENLKQEFAIDIRLENKKAGFNWDNHTYAVQILIDNGFIRIRNASVEVNELTDKKLNTIKSFYLSNDFSEEDEIRIRDNTGKYYEGKIGELELSILFVASLGKTSLSHLKYAYSDIEQKAIEYFGITEDPNEVGFILKDGIMLDMSGKKQGGTPGTRALDHSEIGFIIEEADSSADAMYQFMDQYGAIRCGQDYYEFIQQPTRQQIATMGYMVQGKDINIQWSTSDGSEKKQEYIDNADQEQIEQFIEFAKYSSKLIVSKREDIQIIEECRGAHHGQVDCTLKATDTEGNYIGNLDYAEYQGIIQIQMIDVPEDKRREGIGTALVEYLYNNNSDKEIKWSGMTEEGAELQKSLKDKLIISNREKKAQKKAILISNREK